ncbi:GrpB family protein [Pseudomonas sp. MBLB4123]|uniref:GrpB family protein n=1 Tax=Pseudomonas sp. MBLB4123 TaxID=3451557 RepID=UPI003F74AD4A
MRASTATEDATIEITAYDPAWPRIFAEEQTLLAEALKPWLVGPIEHVGSTSVPGLVAKPIIDIAAPVRSLAESRGAIEALRHLLYQHYPYKPEDMHWFCKPSPTFRTHHLHILVYNSPTWLDRLAFRDTLRSNPELAAQYAALKLQLAVQHRTDREAYTAAKAPFIQAVLTLCRRGQGSEA